MLLKMIKEIFFGVKERKKFKDKGRRRRRIKATADKRSAARLETFWASLDLIQPAFVLTEKFSRQPINLR